MATKNRIAYALPIIQIMYRLLVKLPIQICLRLGYGERVGMISYAPRHSHSSLHGAKSLILSADFPLTFSYERKV